MENCLFCKIIKKEIPADFIYEDNAAVGVLDVNPRAPGHAMVLPKLHSKTILDLPEAQIAAVFAAVKNLTAVLERALKPDGFTIGINHGASAGQVIEHLHVHIIPRFKNDGGSSVHGIVNNPPRESLKEIKEKILDSKF